MSDLPPPPEGEGAPEALPPVEEPRASVPFLVLQFFLFPLGIVAVCVAVFVVFGLIAGESRGARDYLAEIRSGSATRRWQAAFELSKVLQAGKARDLADPKLAAEALVLFQDASRDDPARAALPGPRAGPIGRQGGGSRTPGGGAPAGKRMTSRRTRHARLRDLGAGGAARRERGAGARDARRGGRPRDPQGGRARAGRIRRRGAARRAARRPWRTRPRTCAGTPLSRSPAGATWRRSRCSWA